MKKVDQEIGLKYHLKLFNSFNPKKLLFAIPIIVGFGLLFASTIGGVGLFAHSSPQWLTNIVSTIGQAGRGPFWTMMIGGGVLGLGAIGGGIYGLCRKQKIAPPIEEGRVEIGHNHPVASSQTAPSNPPHLTEEVNKVLVEPSSDIDEKDLPLTIQEIAGRQLLANKKYMRATDQEGKKTILFIDQKKGALRREILYLDKCEAFLIKEGYKPYANETVSYIDVARPVVPAEDNGHSCLIPTLDSSAQ